MRRSEKIYRWTKIARNIDDIDFGANDIAIAEVDGKKICVGKNRGTFFAFAYTCPHAGGILADGCINVMGHVVCPVHGYKFNIQTGYNVSGEGYNLKHWPLQIEEEGVFIGMDAISP